MVQVVKKKNDNNLPANVGYTGWRHELDPWVRKIPWRRAWQPTPVFLPGKSHGQRSLEDYSSWAHKESDTTEHSHTCIHTHTHTPVPETLSVDF